MAGVAVIEILRYNLGQLGDVLAAGIAIAMAFCGLSSVASAGRMLFAFSRDDGVPGSGWLKKVSRTLPHAGQLPDRHRRDRLAVHGRRVHRGPGTAIIIVTAISTIFLYAAYGICIYLGATTEEWRKERVWSLGRWSSRSPGSPSPGSWC